MATTVVKTEPQVLGNRARRPGIRRQWERKLAKHGLAETQIECQDVQSVITAIPDGGEEIAFQCHPFDRELDGTWYDRARQYADDDELDGSNQQHVDGSELDSFHPVNAREHVRRIPAWATDNAMLARMVNHLFPKHTTDEKQREKAGRWARIVWLFFRAHEFVETIAEEMGMTVRAVENVIYRARQVGQEMVAIIFCFLHLPALA